GFPVTGCLRHPKGDVILYSSNGRCTTGARGMVTTDFDIGTGAVTSGFASPDPIVWSAIRLAGRYCAVKAFGKSVKPKNGSIQNMYCLYAVISPTLSPRVHPCPAGVSARVLRTGAWWQNGVPARWSVPWRRLRAVASAFRSRGSY